MLDVKQYYDDVPYFSDAFYDFSPVRLAAIMEFLKLGEFDISNARILEIGCSYGGNLFPFALNFPNARLVGIDISHKQITVANELKAKFNLQNIKFIEADIAALSDDEIKELGEFDFIVAHGVFSWVKEDVKKQLLAKTRALLSKTGVAQISLNVMPGWASLKIIREFMLFVSGDKRGNSAIKECEKELGFFADYLKFSLQSLSTADKKIASQSQQLLASQADFVKNIIKAGKDFYISHEFLEPSNDPIYFTHFSDLLSEAGLCYLLDSSLVDLFVKDTGVPRFDSHIRSRYKSTKEREQLNDFMYNRSFRKAIIVRPEMLDGAKPGAPDVDIEINGDSLLALNFALKFDKRDDGYYSAGLRQNPAHAWLYDLFNQVYPASLSFGTILSLFEGGANDDEIRAAYMGLLDVVANASPKMSVYTLKRLKYEIKKTKLKERLRGYFEYFASTDKPVIAMADELNFRINLDKFKASIALLFDGKKDLKEIEDIALNLAKEAGISMEQDCIKSVQKALEDGYCFEYIKEV